MNNKVNYTLVGFLVLFGMFLMVGFSYWLLQPSNEQKTRQYCIYFDESVLGLNLEAPVKYRGIKVGKVTHLGINAKNSQQVEVQITVLNTTPIKTSTRAKLTSQGITGLSYINLTMGDNNAPMLSKEGDEEYPVIKTTPSFFNTLEKSFDNVSTNLSKTLSGTQKLLNDQNQIQISILLEKSATVMGKLEKIFDEKTIKHIQHSAKVLDQASVKLDKMLPKFEKFATNSIAWENKVSSSFQAIMGSYNGIRETMDVFQAAVSNGDFNLKAITDDVMPTMNNTLLEVQQLMLKVESVLDQYEKSPGDILFKQQEIKKGPGE